MYLTGTELMYYTCTIHECIAVAHKLITAPKEKKNKKKEKKSHPFYIVTVLLRRIPPPRSSIVAIQ